MDFSSRLGSLKQRRKGPEYSSGLETMDSLTGNASNRELFKAKEVFESLQESDGVKYAIGAMTAVEQKYTEISIKEGERVAASLARDLDGQEFKVDTRLQGSVGLDVHIKGYSDVDMLVLVKDTILVQTPQIVPNSYIDALDQRPMPSIVGDLRARAEIILTNNFPKVDVNVNGAKSISLEGGSLARKVDIVPAAWYHTVDFQSSRLDHHIAVKIYNKHESSLFVNYPFLNRKKINDADDMVDGNLKRIVRLMKTLQSDAVGQAKESIKNINSFDVLSIAYDMRSQLFIPSYRQLGLVEILRARLEYLLEDEAYRKNMDTPDLTRKVFDNDNKLEALAWLFIDCNDLADSLVKEINPYSSTYDKKVLLEKAVFG
ncbi:hypothetical protein [Pseudomonas fragi]|uniref:cGAS/DncV-like nucleotidyltransferase C-terminal helical domain-containing protein n=1 Tax=Pseudomonas fragi TaxID=296 RepID=A0A9Q5B401_PSEFR|nr:hypothetical protein [Pseudomonas fragi]NNB51439.1 hypothetical protein [Pseudomonas fragi]